MVFYLYFRVGSEAPDVPAVFDVSDDEVGMASTDVVDLGFGFGHIILCSWSH